MSFFINKIKGENTDKNEEIVKSYYDDEPSYQSQDRSIPKVKKNWLTKNLIIFIGVILVFIVGYYEVKNFKVDIGKKEPPKEEIIKPVVVDLDLDRFIPDPIIERIEAVDEMQPDFPNNDGEIHNHTVKTVTPDKPKPKKFADFQFKYASSGSTKKANEKPINDHNYNRPLSVASNQSNPYNGVGEMFNSAIGKEPPKPTLNDQLTIEPLEMVKATKEDNLSCKIFKGKKISAVVETAIHTSLNGIITATLEHDVYSSDGKNKILEGGNLVTGRFSGGMDFSVDMLFTVWERIETKEGVFIQLDSPGVSPLGLAGQKMVIDNHFIDRFGAASMLSLLNAGASVAGGFASQGSAQTVQDIQANLNKSTEMVLEQSLKIRPTGYAYHGARIVIMVGRDLDFSNVCETF